MRRVLFVTSLLVFSMYLQCTTDHDTPGHMHHDDEDHGKHSEVIQVNTDKKEEEKDHPHDGSHSIEPTLLTLKKQLFSSTIKTGGIITVDRKDIEIITAKSSGIVKFVDQFLFPGVKVLKDQKLFTISGEQLADDNTDMRYRQLKADLEQATTNYKRAEKLVSDKIITEEHYLISKNIYEKTLIEFNNLNTTFDKNGSFISSSSLGYIREVFITEGQKVISGQALASIVIEHHLVLKADISPDYLNLLPSIEQANFRVGYSNKLFKTSEMNGSKISQGKSTGENSFYIPVYFSMNYNPELIEGTFAEVFLIGKEIKDAIVVPNSSLLEEYGKLYVYVKDHDGDYIKRYIKPGYTDGKHTQVIDGLTENETIVIAGAYLIKLSQMSATPPAHNH
jgi:membrane fusion protein, heavy metal efflux system